MVGIEEEIVWFNAWGMVSVEKQKIVVYLSALPVGKNQLNRRYSVEVPDLPSDLRGAALIAANIHDDDYQFEFRELHNPGISTIPQVVQAITQTIDWVRANIVFPS